MYMLALRTLIITIFHVSILSAPQVTLGLESSPGLIYSRLSARLRQIVDIIPQAKSSYLSNIADVGCDHGLLSKAISQSVPCRNIYAIISSLAALKNAQETLYGETKVTTYLGSGLQPIFDKVDDTFIIITAGMGTNTIKEILSPILLSEKKVYGIAVQPWPPYLPKLEELHALMTLYGYMLQNRSISACPRRGETRFYPTFLYQYDPSNCNLELNLSEHIENDEKSMPTLWKVFLTSQRSAMAKSLR